MKSCPTCNRTYPDDTLAFCLVDGSILSAPYDPHATLHASTAISADHPTEVLASCNIPFSPSLEKTLPALPLDSKPPVPVMAAQAKPAPLAAFLQSPLGQVAFGMVGGALIGALFLFAYSFIWLLLNTNRTLTDALDVAPTGAALGALCGLVIEVVFMILSGWLVNRQRAVLIGAILGTVLVFIYKGLLGPCMGNSAPHICLAIHLESPIAAVVLGVTLGGLLGTAYSLKRKTT